MADSTHYCFFGKKIESNQNKSWTTTHTLGNVRRYVESNDKMMTINIDDIILTSCVRPPTRSCTAERDNDAQHGKQRKNDEKTLAAPNAINS